jgi:hypothetical protein
MSPNLELEQARKNWRLFIRFICPLHQKGHSVLLKKCKSNKTSTFLPSSKISNPNVKWKYYFCFAFQEDFWSTALKTLITVSTIILLGLIVAYHALEVQVSNWTFSFFVLNGVHNTYTRACFRKGFRSLSLTKLKSKISNATTTYCTYNINERATEMD